MPLLLFTGSDGNQSVELENELIVGRDDTNDVVITAKGVSRRHCRFFVNEHGEVWVEDLGSSNGVRVGGELIAEPTPVQAGVEVAIGGCRVRVAPARRRSAQAPRIASRTANGEGDPKEWRTAVGPRGTRMLAATEAPKHADPVWRRKGEAADVRPKLKGMAGAVAGVEFELDKPKILVGRIPPADLLLEDDSVSRRHAKIVRSGGRFWVIELGSANGTFVNGDRVSEAELSPGDVVRFGILDFTFSGPASAEVRPPWRLKRIVLLAVAAAGLLAVIGAVAVRGLSARPLARPGVVGARQEAAPEADAMKLMGNCRAYADPESETLNWEQAAKVCSRAFELDPTFNEARALAKRAKKELDFEALLKEVDVKITTTQEEEALRLLVKVDKESAAFARASRKFNDAYEILFKRHRNACKGDVTAGHFEQGIVECQRAVELTCNRPEGPDPEVMGWLKNASRHLGRSSDVKCPPEYAKFQNMGTLAPSPTKMRDALRARYPDGALSKLMLKYCEHGRPRQIVDELKRMRSRDPGLREKLSEVIQNLELVDGSYATGQEYLRLGKAQECLAKWNQAFEAEAKLIPPGVQCTLVKEMSQQLAKVFYGLAKEELQKDHLEKAFVSVHQGYKLDPTNTDLANAIAYMERDANRRINEQPGCASFRYALSITPEESQAHKKAKKAAEAGNCGK